MASVFSRIIAGELPARFVWQDDVCVAFLSINPLRKGHTLVVPRAEVDHWLDLDRELLSHLMGVAQTLGEAIQRAFRPHKVGLMIAGLEVPHVHIHVSPVDTLTDLDFANAQQDPDPEDLEDAASLIRSALSDLGYQP